MSKKKENRKREENAALIAEIEAYQKSFDETFANIEATKDDAERILKLRALGYQIRTAIYDIEWKVINITKGRARRSMKTFFKRAGLVAASLPIFTTPFTLVEASWTSQKSVDEKTRELKNEVNVDGFLQTLRDSQCRIATMLDETVKNCDLKKIYKSVHFPDALHSHEPLKKKFEAAAFARAAGVEDEPEAATEQTPSAESTPRMGSYDKLRVL